ncbi:MAG: DUF1385 domain-containing protein [Chloroflexi bacterium]|nr:DUF1385 domain-containing protein [Chloroflexota bacterium]
MPKDFHYGGQAVIEGVMMRGRRSLAMAVRRPAGTLKLVSRPLVDANSSRIRRIPFVRGIVLLLETMVLGIQALMESANISLEEEEETISGGKLWLVLAMGLGFAVALFFVAPLLLTRIVDSHLGSSSLVRNLVEGAIRLAIFCLYLAAMNLLPDIRRVFSYHGAEHKVINAYEDKAPLEVATVRPYSTAHVRCGTAFLFTVLILAVIVFALLGHPPLWIQILSRILLVPVIAAVGYEATRLAARYADNRFVRVFLLPGLALQAMTTRQPDDSQIETAICALEGVLEADGIRESTILTSPVSTP